MALTVQLTYARAVVAVFDSRDIDRSFPTDPRVEFFNKIDQKRTFALLAHGPGNKRLSSYISFSCLDLSSLLQCCTQVNS